MKVHCLVRFVCGMTVVSCGTSRSDTRQDGATDAPVDAGTAAGDLSTESRGELTDADSLDVVTLDAQVDTDAAVDVLATEARADLPGSDAPDLSAMDASAVDSTAADSSAGDPSDGQPEDGPSCGALVNLSAPITPVEVTSFSHNFLGGVVADGTYVLMSVEETISVNVAPTMFRRTFRVSNSGRAFEWISQDIGSPPDVQLAGDLSIAGTSLVMTDRCIGISPVYPFDAQGTNLTLYYLVGTVSGRVFHYRAL